MREGKQHCQYECLYSLARGLAAAKRLTALPLLVRLDGGHDALDNRIVLDEADLVDFIIKWNPRKQDKEAWLAYAEQHDEWTVPREGKRVALFSITERTITAQGQSLVLPDIEIEGWWTSLDAAEYGDVRIIALYRDHATAEQFHSEFKTDLDIERLPSGKFATNYLIMSLSAYSYTLLRWIGLIGLLGEQSPVRGFLYYHRNRPSDQPRSVRR